jgi:hypothetical protein
MSFHITTKQVKKQAVNEMIEPLMLSSVSSEPFLICPKRHILFLYAIEAQKNR